MRYVARQSNAPIQIRDLTEADATWSRLITSPWLLAKDGDNRDVALEGQRLRARMVADPLFARLFTLVRGWHLPTGETVTLYRRSAGPDFTAVPSEVDAQAAAAVNLIRSEWSKHAQLVYTGVDRAAWLSRANPPETSAVLAFTDKGLAWDLIAPLTGTLFVVLDQDAGKAVRRLDAQAYKVAEAGGDYLWVSIYGMPDGPLESQDMTTASVAWQGRTLHALSTLTTLGAGEVIPLDVRFGGATGALRWSVRLIDGAGQQVASSDRTLAAEDRFGLLIPPNTAPGVYTLEALAYDAATLAPVPADDGRALVELAAITVLP